MAESQHRGHGRKGSSMRSRQKEQMSPAPTSQPYPTMDFSPAQDFTLYDEPGVSDPRTQEAMNALFDDLMADQYPLSPSLNTMNHTDPSIDFAKTDTSSSFFNISSPSGLGTSSYLHVRSDSDNSQRTGVSGSGSANTGGYYTPGELEWDSSAIDVEMQDQGSVTATPQSHAQVLSSMYTPTPQTVPNPYHSITMSQIGEVVYQDASNFTYTTSPQPVKIDSPGPWTPVHYQVPRYDPGYPMFLPSPGPAVEESVDTPLESSESSTPKSAVDSTSTIRERSRPRAISKKPRTKGQEKVTAPITWEHTVVSKDGLRHYSEDKKEARKRHGVRNGKLGKIAAAHALLIRRAGACWPCWVQKVTCSEGDICDRCRKHLHPFSPDAQLCSRAGFKHYQGTFFPDFLHHHLTKREVENLANMHIVGWTGTFITVAVSTGPMFKPIRLSTLVFKPKTTELTTQTRLTTANEGQDSQIVMQDSAPIGLQGISGTELEKNCKRHIDRMVAHPAYPTQSTAGNPNQLPREILEIVKKYCKDTDSPLLQDVMTLHAIHFFMGALLTFTGESAQEVRQVCQTPQAPTMHFSSRLLNRQIKFAMHELHKKKTGEVLDGLERTIKSRSPDSWGTTFCAILVICLCIENLQIAADTLVNTDILKEGPRSQFSRQQSAQACVSLEENPFSQFKRLFHDVYKSHKKAKGKDVGWNPLRLIDAGEDTKLDSTTDEMAKSIYELVRTNWDGITKLANNPSMVNLEGLAELALIKANNTGRLAAIFLKSFFPDS